MIKSRIAVAGALLAAAGAANAAGLTVTPTIATDYDFRGISMTGNGTQDETFPIDPAFQLGVNYGFENGFYLGAWGSNVDLGPKDPKVEVDFTAGYAGGDAVDGIGYDVGATYYTYLDAGRLNTLEIYAGLSKGWFAGKLWYSDDYESLKDSGFYLEGNAAIPMPSDFTLLAHVGYADKQNSDGAVDYSIGAGYNIGKFATSLKYVDGSKNYFNGRFVLAVSTTFPAAE